MALSEKKIYLINKILDLVCIILAIVSAVSLLVQWGLSAAGRHLLPLFNVIDNSVFAIFLIESAVRFLTARSKKDFLKQYWIDLIVIIPGIQLLQGIRAARFSILLRQMVVLLRFCSRTNVSDKLIRLLGIKPAQLLVITFLMTILIGTFLLTLPLSSKSGQGLDFVDALFTATSATCVTGLIVKDTGTFFSLFGQIVILALIQIGALGIMTFSVTLFMAAGKKLSNKQALAMQDVLDQDSMTGIAELVGFIAKMTIFLELLGAIFLYVGFEPYISAPGQRLYIALFHSISAFCNAGFSVFSDSLVGFAKDPIINLTISFLIICGGIGFIVVKDITDKYVKRKRPMSLGLKLHTKLVVAMTAILLLAGTVLFFIAENHHALNGMPFKDKLLVSFFQSVTARTAGFNSVDIGALTNASLFIMIILMFIGASAGSTGGGIKTTTFWILIKAFLGNLRNKEHINSFNRKIPSSIVGKAVAVFILSLGLVTVFMFLLSMTEHQPFRELLFEVVSAFGTVGLSCGKTAKLSMAGKFLITILMFLGRIGPLTIVLAFAGYHKKVNYRYAEERVMVG